MDGFPLRTAVGVVVGVLIVVVWTHLATKPKVIINWGMIEELEGASVEVDGKTVGKLHKFGQNPTTGFELKKGDHEIRIVHDRFESEPLKVTLSSTGQAIHLMAEVEERYERSGAVRAVLVLRR